MSETFFGIVYDLDHPISNCIHVVVIVATPEASQPVQLATLLLIIFVILFGVALIVIIAVVCYRRLRMNAATGEILQNPKYCMW